MNSLAEEMCSENYVEQSNFVKLALEDGEIAFIVAPFLTGNPVVRQEFSFLPEKINVETPWEIIAKKFFYRADSYTIRDVVDFVWSFETFAGCEEFLEVWELLTGKSALIRNRWDYLRTEMTRGFSAIKFDFSESALCDPATIAAIFQEEIIEKILRRGVSEGYFCKP